MKPNFWRWATLRLDRENYQEIMQSLQTDQSRANNIKKIRVYLQEEEDNNWFLNILEDLVTAVQDNGSQLKSLDIAPSGVYPVRILPWASLSPVFLAQLLVSLDKGSFTLRGHDGQRYELIVITGPWTYWTIPSLTPEHVTSLISKIADSSVMNMKSLRLDSRAISHLPPELLSRAVTKLELWASTTGNLTAAQISAVFTKLSVEKDHKLTELLLEWINLSAVPTETVVAVISGLECVGLRCTELTAQQLTEIFRGLLALEDLKLRHLDLAYDNLSAVPTDVLVAGISGLEKVNFSGTNLTSNQLTEIFTRLSIVKEHKLRDLNLSRNNLSSVPTDLLVAVISGLEVVGFQSSSLTSEQITEIFIRLSVVKDHKVRNLDLSDNINDFSSVPTDVLLAGISGLEKVGLKKTKLTAEQLTEIYRMVADRRCPRLREISLYGNDLTVISQELRDMAELNQSVQIMG